MSARPHREANFKQSCKPLANQPNSVVAWAAGGSGAKHRHKGRHLRVFGGRIAQLAVLCSVALALALGGCATAPDRLAVPAQLSRSPRPCRAWPTCACGAMPISRMRCCRPSCQGSRPSTGRARASTQGAPPSAPPVSNLLALSGGADDGAFGAGLLVGWSEHGEPARVRSRHRHQRGRAHRPVRVPWPRLTIASSPACSPATAPTRSTRPTFCPACSAATRWPTARRWPD